uniref:Solute carrier family 25 member 24, like n=2 Tax=Cyprinus carpio TaxID=7962 RepID=A0A8C1NR01_CYPCA
MKFLSLITYYHVVFDVGESRSMPLELTQQETDLSIWGNFILAAGLADAVSITVTATIDLLKTQLQVFGSKAVSLGFRELQTGGFRSLWQGNAVNVLKGTPQSTLQMYTLGERDSLSVHQRFGLGCVSEAVAHAVFYPLEVSQCYSRLEFLTATSASAHSLTLTLTLTFLLWQSIMSWARQDPEHFSDSKLFLFNFTAFASGQASYPLAVIQTHQQAQALCSNSQKPTDALQGLFGIYEKYGVRGLYIGMGASFVRAVPCALLNYTLTSKFETLLYSLL